MKRNGAFSVCLFLESRLLLIAVAELGLAVAHLEYKSGMNID